MAVAIAAIAAVAMPGGIRGETGAYGTGTDGLPAVAEPASRVHGFYGRALYGFLPEGPHEADTQKRAMRIMRKDIATMKAYDRAEDLRVFAHTRLQKLSEVERALLAFVSEVRTDAFRRVLFRHMDAVGADRRNLEGLLMERGVGEAYTRQAVMDAYADYYTSLLHAELVFEWDAEAAMQNMYAEPEHYPELAYLKGLADEIRYINTFEPEEAAALAFYVESLTGALEGAHDTLIYSRPGVEAFGDDALASAFDIATESRDRLCASLDGLEYALELDFMRARAETGTLVRSYVSSIYRIEAELNTQYLSFAVTY